MRFRLHLLAFLSLAACARRPHASQPAPNKYADASLRQIGAAQDERNATALLPFLASPNPAYRREAALAFASVQEKVTSPFLLPLLRDADAGVRRAAAYALGQTGDSTSVDSLRVRVLLEPDGLVRRYVQEALGRCVTRRTLPELWRVEVLADTARAAAQVWGLQRAAIRGLTSAESIRRTVLLLNAEKPLADRERLAAATALARTRGLDADLARLAGPVLLRLVAKDRYYAVRAACATALGRAAAGTKEAPAALARLATKDADYRVRLVAVRALPFTAEMYAGSRAAVFSALDDSREPVALTAAEWLLAHGKGETGAELAARAEKLTAWRPRAVLLAAALKLSAPSARHPLGELIRNRYQKALSPYEKGYLLQAMAEEASHGVTLAGHQSAGLDTLDTITPVYKVIADETFAAKSGVVKGYGLTTLIEMRRWEAFPKSLKPAFSAAMRGALASGDVNQLSLAAEALADARLYPEAKADDLAALHDAQARLQLPRDIEAWQGLQTALDRLEKAAKPTPAPVGTARQHPIDWALVQQIPQNQPVRLRTTQGDIVLELKVNEAPGSVANFVSLVRQHFYDSLYFHRVVPNFVAQGGDPRGDGSGSAPYTLRSEFGDLRYQEGSLGLASAGKDTESCQFFITHAPTPHLDGRYTIFAQVVKGLDVVHKLEIGDRILGVELLQLP